MGVITNSHKYSTTSGVSNVTGITDDIDYPHSGLIKALSQGIRGNYAIKGSATDFDITLAASTFTTIEVTTGKAYRDGKLVTISLLNATNLTGVHATEDVYQLLVAQANNTMTLRGSNSVTNRIPDLTDGDIPIAVIKLVAGSAQGSAGTSDRLIQFLTTSKVSNDLSIGYDNSGYTETANIVGASGVTTITAASSTDVKVKLAGTANTDTFEVIDSAAQVQFKVQGDGEVSTEGLLHSGGNIKVGGNVIQASDGGSTITMDTSDNVTIGGDLSINGGGSGSDINLHNGGNATIEVGTTAAGTAGRDLTISAGTAATAGSNNTDGGDLILNAGGGDGTGTSIMKFSTKVNGTDNAAERMRIHTNGNVGIGTDTPTTALEVSGDTTISRSVDSGQTRTLSIEGARNASGTDYARIDLENYDSHGPTSYVGARISAVNDADGVDDGSLVLSTANAGTLAERMRIDDEGNVGIGTDTPTALLHLKSANTLEPRLLIENTNTDQEEPSLVLRKNSPTPNALTNPASFTDATCDTNHTSGLSDGSSTSVRHITHVANANIVVGLEVTGTGIPSGSTVTIVAINNSTCFTISHDTDDTNTDTTLTFESSEIDDIGIIRFEGEDSTGSNTLYAHILAESRYVTNGQEGGKLNFNVMHQGDSRRLLLVQGSSTSSGSVHVNDGQYDVDFIVEGTGDTALIRADAGNDKVGIGISTPKTKLTVEGAITLKEQANADADTAAYGQLWTKTGAGSEPNELYFTNEAGNDIRLTNGATGPLLTGLHSIYIPASAMYPNTSFGCSALTQVELSNGPEIKVLDFDTASDEFCQFTISFPKSWNEGTLTYEVYWMGGNTNTGDVVWQLKGVCFDDSDPVDIIFGTAANSTAKAHSGTTNDINRSVSASACTVKNATTDSITFFQLNRDVSADTYNSDARLLGMKIFYTLDAGNDE